MTLAEIIQLARESAGQARTSTLWSFEFLRDLVNQAESEAARRSRLILDMETAAWGDPPQPLCSYPVQPHQHLILLHPKIIFVRHVWIASKTLPLDKIHMRDLARVAPDWAAHEPGDVVVWCQNWQKGALLFYHAFDAVDTVTLQVVRLPLEKMTSPDSRPEIDEQHHPGLVNWVLARAYNKLDPDTYNKAKVTDFDGRFDAEFGKRSTATDEEWIRHEHGYDELEGIY
jgi:hypothetical protein